MTYLKHMNLHWTYVNLHWTYVFWKSHFLMNGSGGLKFSAEIHASLNCNMLIAILWLKLAYVICKGSDKRVACQSEVFWLVCSRCPAMATPRASKPWFCFKWMTILDRIRPREFCNCWTSKFGLNQIEKGQGCILASKTIACGHKDYFFK